MHQKWAIEWRQELSSQNSGTCHVFEWETILKWYVGSLGAVWHKKGTSQEHQMSAGDKGMSPAYRTLGHVAHVLLHVRPQGVIFSKNEQYMTFLDGLRLSIRDSRHRRSVGRRTGALGRVTTWRTCSLGVLRGGDILPSNEKSIFYTFWFFSWPQIANGGIDADHISHGDDHVNGS